jgi:hypothetical protein
MRDDARRAKRPAPALPTAARLLDLIGLDRARLEQKRQLPAGPDLGGRLANEALQRPRQMRLVGVAGEVSDLDR